MVILKTKTMKYYPLAVDGGFKLARTNESQRSLGFATFSTKEKAISSGKRWYGQYKGLDEISFKRI